MVDLQKVIDQEQKRAAEAARELEIQILERDGRIDSSTAEQLRGNADDHFLDRGADLTPLPASIIIENQDVIAEEALRKCPLRSNLPLEEQLTVARRDLEAARAKVARERAARPPDFPHYPDLFELHAKQRVRELEIEILERDGKIDANAAGKLRENAENHLRFDAPLEALPAPIETQC